MVSNLSAPAGFSQAGRTAHIVPTAQKGDVFSPSPQHTPAFMGDGKHIFGASKSILPVPEDVVSKTAVLPAPPKDLPSELHEDWYEAQRLLQNFRYPTTRIELQKQLTKPEHMNKQAYAYIQACLQKAVAKPRLRIEDAEEAGEMMSRHLAESAIE